MSAYTWFAQQCAVMERRLTHSSVTPLVLLEPEKAMTCYKDFVGYFFALLCLSHALPQACDGLRFALVREGIVDLPNLFCPPGRAGEVLGQGLWLCLRMSKGAAPHGGTVSRWHTPALLCVAAHMLCDPVQ